MAFEDVDMFEVESSNVESIGYDFEEMVLYVKFIKGPAIYWYSGIDNSLYENFLMSDSKGKFIWQYLRGQYEYGTL